MTNAFPTLWQIGLVVGDIDAASRELSEALGLTFGSEEARQLPSGSVRSVRSLEGPLHFELTEGGPGSPWDGHAGARLDSLSFWVDDLAETSARFERSGAPCFLDETALGLSAAVHWLPNTGFRAELVSKDARARRLGNVPQNDNHGSAVPPWQLGFVVEDIQASRRELSDLLGLEWTPVKPRVNGLIEVCMSTNGLPAFELVDPGKVSSLTWRPGPRFDHIAVWADNIDAESKRLVAAGIPLVQTMNENILFHHGPRSGTRLEVLAGHYRENIRSGWDLVEVG